MNVVGSDVGVGVVFGELETLGFQFPGKGLESEGLEDDRSVDEEGLE